MASIGEAVEQFLATKADGGPVRDRITVNLEQVRHYQLELIAERMDMPKASAAGWLLSMAVRDASEKLNMAPPRDSEDDPEAAHDFWAGFERWLDRRQSASDKAVS